MGFNLGFEGLMQVLPLISVLLEQQPFLEIVLYVVKHD